MFLPYHSESKESPLDLEAGRLLSQLGPFGKKKGVRAEKHLHSYLNDKINTFVRQREDHQTDNLMVGQSNKGVDIKQGQ